MNNVITNAGQLAALKAARQFIVNGTELGFIRMPDADTPDPAHDTLPMIERAIAELEAKPDGPLTNEGTIPTVIGTVVGGDCSDNTVTVQVIGDVPSELWTMGEAVTLTYGHLAATTDINDVLAAAVVEPQAPAPELMKIAADLANRMPLRQLYQICETQGRISSESLHEHLDKAGDLLAGVALDIRRSIKHASDYAAVLAAKNHLVRELDVLLNGEAGAADQASLCDIVAQVRLERAGGAPFKRYVRAPSRKDPKYHEVWPEIEGGPVFDGETYCKDLFEALKRYNVIVAETMPEGAVDE